MYYNTVNEALLNVLKTLMSADEFSGFRLVGGTALSLQLGHRESVDIDLFSDISYGKINFNDIDKFIEARFPYHNHLSSLDSALGKSYSIGSKESDAIKLDVYYTDTFIQPALVVDNIRLATIEEIVAMKIDVVQRGGRKKDFWDLHELLDSYSISLMLDLHEQRYMYGHEEEMILRNFTNFKMADEDFNPVCLRGKHWEFIKEDVQEVVTQYLKSK